MSFLFSRRIAASVGLSMLVCAAAYGGPDPGETRPASGAASSGTQVALGAIVGMVTDAAGLPVARATVTALKMDGGGIRATLSGSDGVYSFSDLPPGTWSVTSQAPGHPDTTVSALVIVAGKATRTDLAMSGKAPVNTPAPEIRHEVLHAGDSTRRQLSAGLQQPCGPHNCRLDGGIPLGRVPDRASQPRW
jgi:hypothetical protein